MSFLTAACGVCGETYTFGVVGSAMVGSGHVCPVKVERDRLRDAIDLMLVEIEGIEVGFENGCKGAAIMVGKDALAGRFTGL